MVDRVTDMTGVGLEDPHDLIDDLDRALRASQR